MNKLEQGVYDAHEKDQNGAWFRNVGNGVGTYVENFPLYTLGDLEGGALPMWKIPAGDIVEGKFGLMGRCYISRGGTTAANASSIADIIVTRAWDNNNLYRSILGPLPLNVGIIQMNNGRWLALLFYSMPWVSISFTGAMFGEWAPQPVIAPDNYTIIAQAA
jgi:hypothetical protein